MEFSRQEYWSGLPFPSPGDLPDPGAQTQVSHIAGKLFTIWATREAQSESISCSVVSDSLRPHGLYVAFQASLIMEFSKKEHLGG